MSPNKTLFFKKVPVGFPEPGVDLVVENHEIDLGRAPEGGLVVEVLYASFDPYLRGKMRPSGGEDDKHSPRFALGDPISNSTVSRVLKSDCPDYKEGDLVVAFAPIAEYARLEKEALPMVKKIENPHGLNVANFLGALGMPGLTAWSGLYEIGKPKKGETIFISSAAGAVGQVVGQVAKLEGLTVIGSVGSDEKLDFITRELGFDAGFNYKKESPREALKRLAPHGIDIYFENVGGDHLEAALERMNLNGRIPVCGMISEYNKESGKAQGIYNLPLIIYKQITMRGFVVRQPEMGPAHLKEHQRQMQAWFADGSIKSKLHVTEGIENADKGLVGIFRGENFGKAVLKIKEP